MSDTLILLGVIVSGFYYWRTLHWRRENQRLKDALRGLLLSADASWESNSMGHDWPVACAAARAALEPEP